MEHFNIWLYQWIGLSPDTSMVQVWAIRIIAESPLWMIPFGLVVGWLVGGENRRLALVHATLAAFVALALAQVMNRVWPHPRPFALGLSPMWTTHVNDGSFPSDHLTLLCSIAFGLWWHPVTRRWGQALAAWGIPVAWSRVALGLHFPLDILGASVASALVAAGLGCYLGTQLAFVTKVAISLYQILARPLIRQQWLRP